MWLVVKQVLSNKWVLICLGAVALFAGGYSTGRYAQPAKVVEKVEVKEVVKEKIVVQTQVKIEKVYLENKNEKVHRVVVERQTPNGPEKTTTETINTDTTTKENSTHTEIKYVDRVVEKFTHEIKEKLVESVRANWGVSAQVGLSIPNFLGQSEIGVPGMKGLVVGANVERRIIGPLWIQVGGNTQGVASVGLRGEF